MTDKDLKLLHKSIYSVGDYKTKKLFARIELYFGRLIVCLFIMLFLIMCGNIIFTAGYIQRPLKHIYFFIPTNKQNKVLDFVKYESFKEVSIDSVESILRSK